MACSMSRCAYQTSRNGCSAKPRIAVRYPSTAARTILRRALAGNPLSRPATARLAASRLTSHSNGPGQGLVEVVDVEDQPPLRRGERAEIGQVRIPAQLHPQPGRGRAGQVRRHRQRRAPVERERGHQHPPVPDRHQLRHPRLRLAQQQPDRIPRPSGVNSACDSSGATARASFPRATRSARLGCSTVPARAEPLPDVRTAGFPDAAPSVFTVMAAPSVCWELPGWPMGLRSMPRAPFHLVAGRGPSP